jgi:hypothetical protein
VNGQLTSKNSFVGGQGFPPQDERAVAFVARGRRALHADTERDRSGSAVHWWPRGNDQVCGDDQRLCKTTAIVYLLENHGDALVKRPGSRCREISEGRSPMDRCRARQLKPGIHALCPRGRTDGRMPPIGALGAQSPVATAQRKGRPGQDGKRASVLHPFRIYEPERSARLQEIGRTPSLQTLVPT